MAVERLARVAAAEVPDTAAAMRLSGMEVTDAVQELSLLGCAVRAAKRGMMLRIHDRHCICGLRRCNAASMFPIDGTATAIAKWVDVAAICCRADITRGVPASAASVLAADAALQ